MDCCSEPELPNGDMDNKQAQGNEGETVKGVFHIRTSPKNNRTKDMNNRNKPGAQPESAFFLGDYHFELESGSSSFSMSSGFCVYNITDMYHNYSDQSSQD